MALGNWRNGSSNKYDKANKYAEPQTKSPNGAASPSVAAPLAIVPRSGIEHFQPRTAPPPAIYNPALGTSRRDRRDAERHVGNLRLATEIAEAATTLEGSMTKLEEAHQTHEAAQQRRVQLGAKIELENLQLGARVMEAQSVFEAAVENRVDERVDRERNRHVEREDFEITIARKRAERLEAQAQEKAAEERLAHASEISRRQAEADLHKASGSAFESEADAEAERRRRDHERQRRHGGEPTDDVPEEFAVHYATENRVSAIRRHAEREVQKIRDAAARAGNDLTPDQEAAIDALLNAADSAEAAIRAGGASDLEL